MKALKKDFFLVLGPIFLIYTLFLARSFWDFWIVIPFALFMIVFKRGLLFSLLFYLPFCIFHHLQTIDQLWQVGLDLSLFLGLFITSLAFSEKTAKEISSEKEQKALLQKLFLFDLFMKEKEDSFDQSKEVLLQKIQEQEEIISTKTLEESSLKLFIEDMKKEAELITDERIYLVGELNKQKRVLIKLTKELEDSKEKLALFQDQEILQQENKRLLDRLNQERVEKEQLSIIQKSLVRRLEEVKESVVKPVEIKDVQEKRTSDLYKQLRSQFEEKGELLHEVRKELFQKNEELSLLRRQQEEKEASLEETSLEKILFSTEEELLASLEENEELCLLVAKLIEERPKKRRNPKQKVMDLDA